MYNITHPVSLYKLTINHLNVMIIQLLEHFLLLMTIEISIHIYASFLENKMIENEKHS